MWTISISTQINCLQKFYGKRAFRACGEKAKRRADVNRFFVGGAERNVLSCSKGRLTLHFFVALRQAVQSFAKTCFAYMGDLSGLLLYKQMKKGKKEKTFAKIASGTKTLLRQGVFGTEKRFFQKILPPFLSTVARKGGVWYNVFR